MSIGPDPTIFAPPADPAAPAPAPDPYQDHETIRTRHQERYDTWKRGREMRMRTCWRNLLFYLGHQDIVYSQTLGTFRPAHLPGKRRAPTNRFASTMDAVSSVLGRSEPLLTYLPATEDAADQATAKVATAMQPIIEQECDDRMMNQILAVWAAFTGGAWKEHGYDPSPEHGMRVIQHEQCQACGAQQPPTEEGVCLACGGPTQPAFGPEGEPVGHQAPMGKMYSNIRSVFEVFFDASIENFSLQHDVIVRSSVSLEAAKRRWPQFTDTLVADAGPNQGEIYQDQLPMIAGPIEDTSGGRLNSPFGRGATVTRRVTESWYYCLPEPDYPEGLLHILIGGSRTAYAGPLPYAHRRSDGTREPFIPLVHFPTKLVPGSGWSKTVADDIAHLQIKKNRIEYLIDQILDKMANPVWLIPEGAIQGRQPTGVTGQMITYNPFGPTGGIKPERIPGQGVPTGLLAYVELNDKEFDEIAALFDVMKGNRPPGVSAGVALQMLQERAMSRFGQLFINWEQGHAEVARQRLSIAREYWSEPRLHRIMGRNGAWEISKFMGADLTGSVDVLATAGSGMPRSTMVEQAKIEQGINLHIIDMRDPQVVQKVREQWGLGHLTPGMQADTKMAMMQCDQFEQLAQNPPVVHTIGQVLAMARDAGNQLGQPVTYDRIVQALGIYGIHIPRIRQSVDNHAIFAVEIGNWLKEEGTLELPMPIQQLAELKHAEHQQLYQQGQQPPAPKVNIALKGALSNEQSAELAGGPAPAAPAPRPVQAGAPGPTGKGSSMLETPQIVQRRQKGRPQPQTSRQMMGQVHEMGRQMGG